MKPHSTTQPSLAAQERIGQACAPFEQRWRGGDRPDLRDYLTGEGEERVALFHELLRIELEHRLNRGERPDPEEYRRRFPDEDGAAVYAAVARRLALANDLTQRTTDDAPPAAPRPLVEVPGYHILGHLGGGGMGVVYKARHLRLDRVVALKMIRSGDQASEVELARFRTEAQAAARLQHPNVVQIFEVGEVAGQPFLCLEFIEGDSLSRQINGHPWPAGAAARLIETLARAAHFAHERGIVHRDLKPGNVLLQIADCRSQIEEPDGSLPAFQSAICDLQSATPKITDFGLAKLLEGDHAHTATGAFVGSPSYAAPEQAGAHRNAIGPHTDIYALGAILYELLTGRPPFVGATILETIRQVLDHEPIPPRRLSPSVSPDLESICLKCLEKPPARRYPSADALADDLARWQRREPILARPPGPLGRAARWCQRHPAATTIAAVVLLGVLGVVWQWRAAVTAGRLAEQRRQDAEGARRDADAERKIAQEEADAAREVADFLGGLFEEANPFVVTPRAFGEQPKTNPTAREIMDRAAKRLEGPDAMRLRPLVRAALLDKVGQTYTTLGARARAAPFLTEALALRRKHSTGDHADLATSLHNVGFLHLSRRELKKSEELFAAALAMRSRLFGPDSTEAMTTRYHVAFVKVSRGDPAAEPPLRELVELQRARLKAAESRGGADAGVEAQNLGFTLITLCNAYASRGRALEALPLLAEAKRMVDKIPNRDLASVAGHFIGFRQWQALGQTGRAVKELQRALDLVESHLGKHHLLYQALQMDLAYLHFSGKQFEQAEKVFVDLERNHRESAGEGPWMAQIHYEIARSVERGALAAAPRGADPARRRDLAARAERYARSALRLGQQHGDESTRLDIFANYLAYALLYVRPRPDYAGAAEAAREAVRLRTEQLGVGHELTSHPRAFLLVALARQGKADELEKVLRDLLARDPRPKWDGVSTALPEAARALSRAGKARAALTALEQAAAAGQYNLEHVRTDPALASLRDLPEYRRLLARPPK